MRVIPRRLMLLASVVAGCALFVGRAARSRCAACWAEGRGARHPRHHVRHAERRSRDRRRPAAQAQLLEAARRRLLPLVQGTPSTCCSRTDARSRSSTTGSSPDKRYKVAASISKPDGVGFNLARRDHGRAGQEVPRRRLRVCQRLAGPRDPHRSVVALVSLVCPVCLVRELRGRRTTSRARRPSNR